MGAYARNVQIINQALDGTSLTDDLNFWDVLTSNYLLDINSVIHSVLDLTTKQIQDNHL